MSNPVKLGDILAAMSARASEAIEKTAFQNPQQMMPQDPAMGGAPPMDPAMAGGMPPPPAAPPSGGMAPPMDPAMAGGMPPPPAGGMGAPPPVDPAMIQQMLADPSIQQMLQQMGIGVDPQQGAAFDMQTGQPISPEELMAVFEQVMSMDPAAMGGGMPAGAPMAPEGDTDLDARLSRIEEQIGSLFQVLGIDPDDAAGPVAEGMTEEAAEAAAAPVPAEAMPPVPAEAPMPPKMASERPSRKEDPAIRMMKLISRMREIQ